MKTALAFDVYGTLIDTAGVVSKLRESVGGRADEFSRVWREKQLEYSFRRGLMKRYEHFGVCTSEALDYTCTLLGAELSDAARQELLGIYRVLPAFDDVTASLTTLPDDRFELYAFSNGTADAVEGLLEAAAIRPYFTDVVSVDELGTFKPNPAVYRHFLKRAGADGANAWLISSNPFDVIGAVSAGMRAAWVRRSPSAVFDPWGIEPTITVAGLAGLGDRILAYRPAS